MCSYFLFVLHLLFFFFILYSLAVFYCHFSALFIYPHDSSYVSVYHTLHWKFIIEVSSSLAFDLRTAMVALCCSYVPFGQHIWLQVCTFLGSGLFSCCDKLRGRIGSWLAMVHQTWWSCQLWATDHCHIQLDHHVFTAAEVWVTRFSQAFIFLILYLEYWFRFVFMSMIWM